MTWKQKLYFQKFLHLLFDSLIWLEWSAFFTKIIEKAFQNLWVENFVSRFLILFSKSVDPGERIYARTYIQHTPSIQGGSFFLLQGPSIVKKICKSIFYRYLHIHFFGVDIGQNLLKQFTWEHKLYFQNFFIWFSSQNWAHFLPR